MEKLEGPTTRLTFEIDTLAGVLRLPREKVARINWELCKWQQYHKCKCKQLELLMAYCNVNMLARWSTQGAPSCSG